MKEASLQKVDNPGKTGEFVHWIADSIEVRQHLAEYLEVRITKVIRTVNGEHLVVIGDMLLKEDPAKKGLQTAGKPKWIWKLLMK
jgi:hypothetical protein